MCALSLESLLHAPTTNYACDAHKQPLLCSWGLTSHFMLGVVWSKAEVHLLIVLQLFLCHNGTAHEGPKIESGQRFSL